ncbi:MAG: hypothetical protein ACR2NM_16805 [Bythopirellula sp.]
MIADCGVRIADWNPPTRRDWFDRRHAMTLFELLLVLVLLVVVGSLAAPLFEGSFSSLRLRRGTDQILAAWSEARTQSIESGQIYQFRFKPDAGDYRVDPWSGGLETELLEDETLVLGEVTSDQDTNHDTDEEAQLANWKSAAELPESIVFSNAQQITENELGQRQLTNLDEGSLTEWSAPILFFPDGTTSESSLLLKNSKNLYCRATLRSLTGVGRASDLLTREQVDRLKPR